MQRSTDYSVERFGWTLLYKNVYFAYESMNLSLYA